jgi:hypothetical protein
VKLEWKSKQELRAELSARVNAAGPEIRILASALAATPTADEPAAITHLRSLLQEQPQITTMVRRQLATVGLSSPDAYRALHPALGVMTVMDAKSGVDCGPPQLSVRLAKVDVIEDEDDFANDIVYCAISTDSAKGSEVRVTPKTPPLDEGESYEFSPQVGTVWGQKGPREAGGDLTLTYDCFESDDSQTYNKLLEGLANTVAKNGTRVDDSGWTSAVAGAIAAVLPSILALDGDDHLFKAKQVISASDQLKLTNGGSWTVNKKGTHLWSDWEWTLHMEVWGCAVNGGGPRPPSDAGADR